MVIVRIAPENVDIEVEESESVLDALLRTGVSIESPCAGNGTCAKCMVQVEPPENSTETPHPSISEADALRGLRLACASVPTGDLTLRILGDFSLDGTILTEGVRKHHRLNPPAHVFEGNGEHHLSYGATYVTLGEWGEEWIPLAVAIDVGTTTLALSLVDIKNGDVIATQSSMNPQVRHGHDVVSRIQLGSTQEGLSNLCTIVRHELNRLLERACTEAKVKSEQIVDSVIGGNTTMLQLLGEIDPEQLGQIPFTVGLKGGRTYRASSFGINANANARCYIPPIVHAYVGTDLTVGLVATGFFDSKEPTLFVDIGTNGEIALISGDKVWATSAAAGPAFEGVGLSCGMRAAPGAVEAVWGNGELNYRTIDETPPKGICGSGVMDVLAWLLNSGTIDSTGRMKASSGKQNGKPALSIAKNVSFSQADVRQAQLAKSAVRTAIDLLLEHADITPDTLGQIILAGGFGRHLRPQSLVRIGLLPPGTEGKITFAGNTSLSGSTLLLLDSNVRDALESAADTIVHIELASLPEFQSYFVQNLEFPSTA